MSSNPPPTSPAARDSRPILDSERFHHRLDEEVARVRRSGGFLALAVFGTVTRRDAPSAVGVSSLAKLAERLRASVRLEDVLAARADRLVLLMPETNAGEAARAADRLLRLVGDVESSLVEGERHPLASAGLSATYGEVEGGGSALLAAAEVALGEAEPGGFAISRTLVGRPRLLVIDDDLTFAETLAETISEREWEAHPCTEVADARERVKDMSYSGFFIDVVLPGIWGVDILRDAMAVNPGRPAVLMSGKDVEPAMILDALSMGPVMFIRKPLSHDDLDTALAMFRQLVPGIRRRGRRVQ